MLLHIVSDPGMFEVVWDESHWKQGGLEPVITCWKHWELWLNEPSDSMVLTYRIHLKCTHNMCSIWDRWEHFCGVWIVTSTCASYVTTHNSWQSFEICPTIFSKCSYYIPSGNILITWFVLRNIWNLFKMLFSFLYVIMMFPKQTNCDQDVLKTNQFDQNVPTNHMVKTFSECHWGNFKWLLTVMGD